MHQRRVFYTTFLAALATHLLAGATAGVCTNGATCEVPLPGVVSQGRVFQCTAGCSGALPVLTDGNSATTWSSPVNVAAVTVTLPLEAPMTIYSVDVYFSSSQGPAQAFTISYRNALNQSKIVVQQFAANCQQFFGTDPQYEAEEAGAETYCTPTNARPVQSADFTLNRNLEDPLTAKFLVTSLVEIEFLALPVNKNRYVIESIVVHGTCFCNGRATACAPVAYVGAPSCSQPSDCVSGICASGACALAAAVPAGCACQDNSAGANCEMCAPLFNAAPWTPGSQPSSQPCSECTCNNHASACSFDASAFSSTGNGGVCNCTHNTVGADCSSCQTGFHYDSTTLVPFTSPSACQACNCDNAGSTGIACTNAGKCTCKANVLDDQTCSQCKSDFWGLSASNPLGCDACSCGSHGAFSGLPCNITTGACVCKPNVVGSACDTCAPQSYFGTFTAGMTGCTDCACDSVGSTNNNCDSSSGQCACRPGVTGRACDACSANHYGLSLTGCTACACHVARSTDPSCHLSSGQCSCMQGASGRDCATCDTGYFHVADGPCQDCGCDEDGSTSNACSLGVCTCRPGFAGDKCDQCAFGSVGVFPNCVACPTCFSDWKTLLQQLASNIATTVAGAAAVTSQASGNAAEQIALLEAVGEVEMRLDALMVFIESIDLEAMTEHAFGTMLSHQAIQALIFNNDESIANLTLRMATAITPVVTASSNLTVASATVSAILDAICQPGQPSSTFTSSVQLLPHHAAAMDIETGENANDVRFRFRSTSSGPLVWFGESATADRVLIMLDEFGFVEVSVTINQQTVVLTSANSDLNTSYFDNDFHSVRFVRGNSLQLIIDGAVVDSHSGSLGPLLRPTSSTVRFGSLSQSATWTGCLDAIEVDGVAVTLAALALSEPNLTPCPLRACHPQALATHQTTLLNLVQTINANLADLSDLELSLSSSTAAIDTLGSDGSAASTRVDALSQLLQSLGSNLTAIAALVNQTDEDVLRINSIIADFPSLEAAEQALADAQSTLSVSSSLLVDWTVRRDAWIAFGNLTNRTVSHARWAITAMLQRGEEIASQTAQATAWVASVPGLNAQVQAALGVDGPLLTVQADATAALSEALAFNGSDARGFLLDMQDADGEPFVTFDATGETQAAALQAQLDALSLPLPSLTPRASSAVQQLSGLAAVEAAVQTKTDAISLVAFPAQYDAVSDSRTEAITRANTLCDTIAATTISAFATYSAADARNRRISSALTSATTAQTAASASLLLASQANDDANTCHSIASASPDASNLQQLLSQLDTQHQQQVSDLAALATAITAAEDRLGTLRTQFLGLPSCPQ